MYSLINAHCSKICQVKVKAFLARLPQEAWLAVDIGLLIVIQCPELCPCVLLREVRFLYWPSWPLVCLSQCLALDCLEVLGKLIVF